MSAYRGGLFKNKETIYARIVGDLRMLSTTPHTRSWNLVIPPGFYAAAAAEELRRGVHEELPEARIAKVSADGIFSSGDLVEQIREQWAVGAAEMTVADNGPAIQLGRILEAAGDGTKVIIISEFHKLLNHIDERILVALRDAEQSGRLHTIAISIYPHSWLRHKWRDEGRLLNVSNYGDHVGLRVVPYEKEDVDALYKASGAPAELIRLAYEWGGGIPETMDAVVEEWLARNRPGLTPDTRKALRRRAEETLERVALHIDETGSTQFGDLLIGMHLHKNAGEAYAQFERFHPWSFMLLAGGGLKSDVIGDVLLRLRVERAFHAGKYTDTADHIVGVALAYYKSQQYDLVLSFCAAHGGGCADDRLLLIGAHARIMQELCGQGAAAIVPGADTQWRTVLDSVREARGVLLRMTGTKDVQCRLEARYQDIERLGETVLRVRKRGRGRYIDEMSRLATSRNDKMVVFTLLALQWAGAASIRGHAAACKCIMEMPEQAVRVWGLWRFELEYYTLSALPEGSWTHIVEACREAELECPPEVTPGAKCSSLYDYMCYLYGMQSVDGGHRAWSGGVELRRELDSLSVRNDIAHAAVSVSAAERRRLFGWGEDLLKRIEEDCLDEGSRALALEMVLPLPIPSEEEGWFVE